MSLTAELNYLHRCPLLPPVDGEGRHVAAAYIPNEPDTALIRGTDGYQGRHRAARYHAFVQHRNNDRNGCGRMEDDEPDVRCGYYRRAHATMAAQAGDPHA